MVAAATAICGILILWWSRIASGTASVVFSVLYGFVSGVATGFFPGTVAIAAPYPKKAGMYIGLAMGPIGFVGPTGTPITRVMISRYGSCYAAMIFGGVNALAAAAFIHAAKHFHLGADIVGQITVRAVAVATARMSLADRVFMCSTLKRCLSVYDIFWPSDQRLLPDRSMHIS